MIIPRTVVHCVDSDIFGGCEQVILSLLSGLDRKQWNPILFCHDPRGESLLVREVRRQRIQWRSVADIRRGALLSGLWNCMSALREVRAEVFHAHLNWPLACRYELVAAQLVGIRAVVASSHICSPLSEVAFTWLKQGIQDRAVDRYIAVSQHVENWLCDDLRVKRSKVRVIRNGVCLAGVERPRDAALRERLVGKREGAVVLASARLHSGKGFKYLVEAAKLVPEALFLIAGDGPERPHLERYARELGVDGQITFLGHRDDIPELLAASDIFVLPTLYEALGLSVIEAMAAGKPVVTTCVGGLQEVVEDGVTGILVPPKDPVRLASAIRRVVSDPNFATRIAQAGRARASGHFSLEGMVHGVTKVYEELLRN